MNPFTGNPIMRLKIVAVKEIIDGKRENYPNTVDVVNKAER
jgi:hypothetical protein